MFHDSSIHYFFNWSKGRIDEMDAAVSSLEAKAGDVQADLQSHANQLLFDLRKRRDDFKAVVNNAMEANTADINDVKLELETEWTQFEIYLKKYVETFGDKVKQQQSTFKLQADAQLSAWRDAANNFEAAATQFAAERRTEFDAVVNRMRADAGVAEDKINTMKGAGTESWSALMTGLTETRAAADRANQSVREAFKKATAV